MSSEVVTHPLSAIEEARLDAWLNEPDPVEDVPAGLPFDVPDPSERPVIDVEALRAWLGPRVPVPLEKAARVERVLTPVLDEQGRPVDVRVISEWMLLDMSRLAEWFAEFVADKQEVADDAWRRQSGVTAAAGDAQADVQAEVEKRIEQRHRDEARERHAGERVKALIAKGYSPKTAHKIVLITEGV